MPLDLNPKQRADLHTMLDELLDAREPGSTSGVLMLREVLVSDAEGVVNRSLSLRGAVGRRSDLLQELVRHLKTLQP